MTKITIPIVSALEPGGTLVEFVANLSHVYSAINKIPDAVNLTIQDENPEAPPDQKLVLDQDIILDILAATGDIENYLFGIRQPSASASLKVPGGVPLREFILYNTNPIAANLRDFSQWYSNNADVWLNDATDEIIYYNNPNPSGGPILKASEAEIIRQLDPNANDSELPQTYTFLTIAEVQEVVKPGGVPDPNWVKL